MTTKTNKEPPTGNETMKLNRRSLLKLSAATFAAGTMGLPSFAQQIDELVIAYNVNLPSWDPTVGPSAVNPKRLPMMNSWTFAPACSSAPLAAYFEQ